MPITPFHFGPGAALHAAAPRKVSFMAFCAANVVVDVEPLYYMVTGQFPLHRFFHTYVGVSLVVALTIALCVAGLRFATWVALPNLFRWKQLTVSSIALGAVCGGYSHIVFDSIMHSDMRPLAPFSDSNGLLHVISLGALHWLCLGAGVLGVLVLAVRSFLAPAPDAQPEDGR